MPPSTLRNQVLDDLLGCRSLARRKIAIFLAELDRFHQSNHRTLFLATLIGGEVGVAATIELYEQSLIQLESPFLEKKQGSMNNLNDASIPCILDCILGTRNNSSSLYDQSLQIQALTALWNRVLHQSSAKLQLVNAGGIYVLIKVMQVHSTSCQIQKLTTSILISLAFSKANDNSTGVMYYDTLGIQHSNDLLLIKRRRISEDAADMSIVALLLGTHVNTRKKYDCAEGFLTLVSKAVTDNAYEYKLCRAADPEGNYERSLAVGNILSVCKTLLLTTEPSQQTRRRVMLLRTCLASLLEDPGITQDTLGAILQ
jgi:hypothetical protein